MPFRSKAQARLFFAKHRRGEISDVQLKRWKEETPSIKRLPERVKKHGHSKEAKVVFPQAQGTLHDKEAFCHGFAKSAFDGNLPEQAAATEAASDFTQAVKGSGLREKAETGQARGGYSLKDRTGETRVYPQSMRHRWRSSRG